MVLGTAEHHARHGPRLVTTTSGRDGFGRLVGLDELEQAYREARAPIAAGAATITPAALCVCGPTCPRCRHTPPPVG